MQLAELPPGLQRLITFCRNDAEKPVWDVEAEGEETAIRRNNGIKPNGIAESTDGQQLGIESKCYFAR
jgi:hypothetical protein